MKFKTLFEAPRALTTNAGQNDLKTAQQVDSNSKEDMDAFDKFGPKTRDVLNNHMVVKWSAAQTLKHVKGMGVDPANPSHDAMIAQNLMHANERLKGELKVEEVIISTCTVLAEAHK